MHSVIGPNGELLEGWKEQLVPEELRHEASLDAVTDVPSAFKQLVHSQRMVGKDKISIPGENASDDERDAFQMALGRPATKEQYEVEFPEDVADRFDADSTKENAFKIGLPQKTLNDLIALRAEEIRTQDAAEEAADKAAYEEAEKIVVAQAGEALEDQRIRANRLIAEHVPEKTTLPDGTTIDGQTYQEHLLEALNDHALRPWVFNFLANIHRDAYGEHDGITNADGRPGAMTIAMMEAKAEELTNTPGYLDQSLADSAPEKYKRLTSEITALYDRIEKAQKAVG
jgi:hypothetical protein